KAGTFKWIEAYDQRRYFTLTGEHLAGTPTTVEERQEALDWLLTKYEFVTPPAPPPVLKPPATVKSTSTSTPKASAIDRCKAYLQKCPDAISGQGGHDATLRAACECYRFGLSDADAETALKWFNDHKTGGERWTDEELQHKLKAARDKVQAE